MPETAWEKSISPLAADRLISAHDGDVALLYIYRLRTGCTDPERTAQDLCRTLKEIEAADEKLRRMELFSAKEKAAAASVPHEAPAPAPAREETMPEYTSADVVKRSREDGEVSAIFDEARKVMGRNLSSTDMKTLLRIYDYFGIPAAVLMELMHYCGRVNELKYHGQRRPSVRSIEKEADRWARLEILTIEQAEEYVAGQERRRSLAGQVKEALGIRGRALSKSEREYIGSWLDMGFGPEALAIAYDRTVTNTGSLKWGYMNSIVRSWNEKKLFTPQEIEEKDSRGGGRRQKPSGGSASMDFDTLDNILDGNKI
ncbi:MAG: DnaD domain protein [Candidatus Limivicinus sp.]|jgi:hypothetical protein